VLLEAHDLGLDLERQLVSVAIRPARAVGEPVKAGLVVAPEDLVSGLARDAELAAQPCHFLPVQQSSDELEPFIHRVTLLPGHFALPQKARLCNPCLRNELSPFSQEGHLISIDEPWARRAANYHDRV